MRPVIEYRDYREYIHDYYAERKRTSAFSWREFARNAGFSAASFLHLVSDKKARLSGAVADRTARAMGLAGYEVEYFSLMVEYGNAKTPEEGRLAFERMLELSFTHKVKVVGADFYGYYKTWLNAVVRELAPAMPHAKPLDIARACRPKVSAAAVSESLDFLTHSGLLKRDAAGIYHETHKSVSTGPLEAVPVVLHSLARQMGELALEALDTTAPDERNFSGITMGVSADVYRRIVDELADCRRRIVAIASESPRTEKVLRLNLQLFPMTERLDDVTFKVAEQSRSDLSERMPSTRPSLSSPLSFWRGDAPIESRGSMTRLNKKHPSPKRRKK